MFLKASRSFKKTFSIFAFSLLIFAVAGAALAVDYKPLVNIPGFTPATGSTLTGYLSGLYNFLISIVGILAMGVIIYGGMRYVVSAGNPAAMEDAKEAIWSAVYGLALALGSWLIINVVNPDILVLKNPGVAGPGGGYSYNDGPDTQKCSLSPSGMGTEKDPCKCADGKDVTFTQQAAIVGPYMVSSPTIAPCALEVPITTHSITFHFNEPLKASSIDINNSNTSLRTITFTEVLGSPPPLDSFTLNGNDLTISWLSDLYLGSAKTVTIRGSKVKKDGSSNSAYITNVSGIPMEVDYVLYFTTQDFFGTLYPCTPPPLAITTCKTACAFPATLGLDPPGYHCLKADLRVGKTKDDRTHSSITAKKDETLYFDADTYVKHNKPIVSYEMDYKNDFYSAFSTDKACDVAGAIRSCHTGLTWASMTPCNGISQNSYKYTATGVYQAWMRVYDEDCHPSESTIDITIENY